MPTTRWRGSGPTGEWRRLAHRSREVVLVAGLVGVVTGLVVAGFDTVVVDLAAEHVAGWPLWAVVAMPVLGLGVANVLLARARIGPGTSDEFLRAFHEPDHRLGVRHALVRLGAAIATLGSGGPMGLEGPSLYFGSTVGATAQRRLPGPLRGSDRRTLLVAGAAAGVAAIFKAPATGAVFALEVPYRDDLGRRMLLPALVSSASGYLVFVAIHGTTPLFRAVGDPAFSFRDLAGAVLLGVLAGFAARGFAGAIRAAKRFAIRPPLVRWAAGSAALVAVFVLVRATTGTNLGVGSGYEVVAWAGSDDHSLWILGAVLVLRSAATVRTVAAGGVGGLFIPLVVGGSLLGRLVGEAVGSFDTSLFTVVGVAAFLGAGYRVPLAAVTFVAETTGRPGFVVPGLIAAVAAELVVGHASVTPYQRDPVVVTTRGHSG